MKVFPFVLILSAWAGLLLPGQVATDANRRLESAEGRQRLIEVLSKPERVERLRARKLVKELGLRPGDTVVDLGTGAGILLPLLAEAVGPAGTVIAQDIHQDFLDAARKTAEEAGIRNLRLTLGSERNPNLEPGVADVIVTVDTYHHFNYPQEMLAGIRAALKPGGRFAVLDYYQDGFGDPDHIRADKAEVIREIEAAGFRLVADQEHVPGKQYLIIFTPE